MTKLNIDLGDLAPTTDAEASSHPPTDPMLEVLFRALETPRGLEVECKDAVEAKAMRFRFYRARRKSGLKSLDGIYLRQDGNKILILPPPSVQIREL